MRPKTVKRGPPPKAAKKTATKTGDIGQARRTLKQIAKDTAAADGPKYETIGDVMRAKAKDALPRGAKFELHSDRAVLVAGKVTLLNVAASEVARWALRKLGYKAEFAA